MTFEDRKTIDARDGSEERAREAIGAEGGGVLRRAEFSDTMAKLRQLFDGVLVQRRED